MATPKLTPPRLHLSKDRKVSPGGTYQAKDNRWLPNVPNSLGLPAGRSCPGLTPFCGSCYAARCEHSKGVREAMDRNLALLRAARSVDGMADLLDEAITYFEHVADRRQLEPADRIFRIHWDGDFFSVPYADAWAQVIARHPDVHFWAYTRSFTRRVNVVPALAGLRNLALYLSVDKWNYHLAAEQIARHPDVHLAGSADDFATAKLLTTLTRGLTVRDVSPAACPENAGTLPLMDAGRGACTECRLCPFGIRDVAFATQPHRRAAPVIHGVAGASRPAGPTPRRHQEDSHGSAA